ncbi:hypothetical protein BegalDRAFT_2786 [Beggiatoa alba B18LD]|uniref:Uncharacterized protein n=1 Tax=Beggiatoa alba B18LD TaxID=395493 RepID=I3CJ28_9GAMM|nr:hypothetical protein [Beggiatoa alba]EIJ43621.1 hypothetical protein BegalDRAFT_2786 [Beggiatoa alba B18LD]
MYSGQKRAQKLYEILKQTLSDSEVQLWIEGEGVDWSCYVKMAERVCNIACFEPRDGYYIVFMENKSNKATGRTTHIDSNIIQAIKDWIYGHSFNEFYDKFDFINNEKKGLQKFLDASLINYPELKQCTIDFKCQFGDSYFLWFKTQNRACCLRSVNNRICQCEFYSDADWDSSNRALFDLFEEKVPHDVPLDLIIKYWLCDNFMPSQLEQHFLWFKAGKLAHYYELGKRIEGEFILSWEIAIPRIARSIDYILDVFPSMEEDEVFLKYRKAIENKLKFFLEIRNKRYDQKLRIGHAVDTIILSRSRKHGLVNRQAHIIFDFPSDGSLYVNTFYLGKKTESTQEIDTYKVEVQCNDFFYEKAEYTQEIDILLQLLVAQDIT